MNIYEVILHDHRLLLDVLDSIEATPEPNLEQRIKLLRYFRTEWTAHSRAEEDIFYGALRSSDLGRYFAEELMDDHGTLERLVHDIESTLAENGRWIGKFRMLRQIIETHMEKEQSELFALARQFFPPQQAEDLADRMLADKSRYITENLVARWEGTLSEKVNNL